MTWFLTATERQALRRTVRLLKVRPGAFLLALLLGVCGMGAAIGLAATSAWLIARASQMPPVLALTVAATAVRMFGVMRALFRYLQRLASHHVALDGMDELRIGIYDTLSDGPIDHVAQLQRGDLLNRAGADVDAVGDMVVKSLLPAAVTLIVGVGTVIGFAFLSVPAALVLLACLLISGLLVPLLNMRATRLGETLEQQSQREMSVASMNILEGADELLVDGTYQRQLQHLDDISSQLNRARSLAARPASLAAALDRAASVFAVVGVLLVSTPEVTGLALSAVAFAVLVLTPLSAFEGTSEMAPAAAQLVRSAQAAVRIEHLLGTDLPPSPPPHPVPPSSAPELIASQLSVGWPGAPTIATGITLRLAPGTRTAVVGPSGVGKSTLLYTLAGMLPPHGGEAELNGAPIWAANRTESTKLVSLTTEDAHIFATTIYENLRVGSPHLGREEAVTLLNKMGLAEWLSALPQGIDTQLGAAGTTVSGGERRRILLARALADPAPLLLLDEPGEHLDAATAEQIMTEILDGGRGVVLVTHRLSELEKADEVIVLGHDQSGVATITDRGTHHELVSRSAEYRWALEQEHA